MHEPEKSFQSICDGNEMELQNQITEPEQTKGEPTSNSSSLEQAVVEVENDKHGVKGTLVRSNCPVADSDHVPMEKTDNDASEPGSDPLRMSECTQHLETKEPNILKTIK